MTTESPYYYPGQAIKLNYEILDELGNVIQYNSDHSITVRLEHSNFLTDIIIDGDGICHICETGIVINVLSIHENYGEHFTMNVSVMEHVLYATNPELTLEIIGCPHGKGPDLNNISCTTVCLCFC